MSERRRLRASFTSTLTRICKLLDVNPSAMIELKHPLIRISMHSQFTLKSLWVAGSYARGAPDCGDLDLIAELNVIHGELPNGRRVAKALFNSPRDIRLYVGTPSKSESGVEFPEAILIWQGQCYSWREAIAGIVLDPNAGRYSRPINRIPLRLEQLHTEIETLEEILKLEKKKIIRWGFTSLNETKTVEPLSEDEKELTRVMSYRCGFKTRRLLPHLMSYLRNPDIWPQPFLRSDIKQTTFKYGGASVLIGRPAIPVYELDDITSSRILIVPHQSTRGPNGFWMIERADKHPLVLAVKGIQAFCLVDETGQPIFAIRLGTHDVHFVHAWTEARQLDFYTSEKDARKRTRQLSRGFKEKITARALNSRELLTCLSQVDVAVIDDGDYALTWCGAYTIEVECTSSTQDVLKALAGRRRKI